MKAIKNVIEAIRISFSPLASRKTLRSFSRSSVVAFTRMPKAPEIKYSHVGKVKPVEMFNSTHHSLSVSQELHMFQDVAYMVGANLNIF